MVDPVTNNRSITLPTVGGDSGTWGTIQNSGVFSQLDLVLGATQTASITVSDVTLSQPQWNNAAISLSGALTADRNLILPLSPNSLTSAVGGYFVVENVTSGAFNVTVKTVATGSTGVKVPQGLRAWLYSDGTNVKYASDTMVYVTTLSGSPNGTLAGTAASVNNPPYPWAFDYVGKKLWVPTTTGTASSAVWQQVLLNSSPTPTALFTKLVIKVLTNTTASVSAAGVTVTDGGGNYLIVAPNSTINFATTGANGLDTGSVATSTWYSAWVIAKADGTTACLASTSSTFAGLTLPSGYIYGGRVGYLRTSSSVAQLLGSYQFGRQARYVLGLAQTTTLPTISNGTATGNITASVFTGTPFSVSNFVPPTASAITLMIGNFAGANVSAAAPNASYSGYATVNPPPLVPATSGAVAYGALQLETTNIYFASTSVNSVLVCMGWEDNL